MNLTGWGNRNKLLAGKLSRGATADLFNPHRIAFGNFAGLFIRAL
jgi:hypothetical protein